jgi:hypothetical protein
MKNGIVITFLPQSCPDFAATRFSNMTNHLEVILCTCDHFLTSYGGSP